MATFSESDLKRFWPHADPDWLHAFARNHDTWGKAYGVDTRLRWQHFLAQVSAETGGLRTDGKGGSPLPGMRENLRYSVDRFLQVFSYRIGLARKRDPRFKGWAARRIAEEAVRDPKVLAELVYGNRPELGNVREGDGWKYIGRGPLQCTGFETYELVAHELGIDTIDQPELLEKPEYGWQSAFIEWRHSKINTLADRDDVEAVSRRVNGGTNGLAARRAWLKKAKTFWPHDDDFGEPDPRDEATVADLAATSTKVQAARIAQKAAVTVAVASGTVEMADSLSKATENISGINALTGAIATMSAFIKDHAFLALIVGALLAWWFAGHIIRKIVSDYVSGRYTPSGEA